MRKCKRCNKTKECKDFYLSDKSVCKKCLIKRAVDWKKSNPDKVKRYRIRLKKYQVNYYREWYKAKGRKRSKQQLESANMWNRLNPEYFRISQLLRYAIKIGKIKKSRTCETCKEKRKLVGHHEDYNFPFKVKWLCYSCHKNLHNSKKNILTS